MADSVPGRALGSYLSTMTALRRVLATAGVEFIDESGGGPARKRSRRISVGEWELIDEKFVEFRLGGIPNRKSVRRGLSMMIDRLPRALEAAGAQRAPGPTTKVASEASHLRATPPSRCRSKSLQ
jgi:hypothetical protein